MLLAVKAGAQIANDDCAGGFSQGVWHLATWSTNCDDPGSSTNGSIIRDSTHLAVPNFPYPTNPSPCVGYTTTVAAPANDRWYAVQVGCELGFTIECTDTCHISFWSGNDCGMLTPLDCYTIPPNTPTTGLVWTLDNLPMTPDTLLLQISGNGVGQHTDYTLCLTNPTPPCAPIYVEPAPTPVTCLHYDTLITPASSPTAADGSASIVVELGNGPFEFLWGHGATTPTVVGLTSGYHAVSITDAIGCVTHDTLFIPYDLTTSQVEFGPPPSCGLSFGAAEHVLMRSAEQSRGVGSVTIFDRMGRPVWTSAWPGQEKRLFLPNLPSGIYCAMTHGSMGPACVIKFTTNTH